MPRWPRSKCPWAGDVSVGPSLYARRRPVSSFPCARARGSRAGRIAVDWREKDPRSSEAEFSEVSISPWSSVSCGPEPSSARVSTPDTRAMASSGLSPEQIKDVWVEYYRAVSSAVRGEQPLSDVGSRPTHASQVSGSDSTGHGESGSSIYLASHRNANPRGTVDYIDGTESGGGASTSGGVLLANSPPTSSCSSRRSRTGVGDLATDIGFLSCTGDFSSCCGGGGYLSLFRCECRADVKGYLGDSPRLRRVLAVPDRFWISDTLLSGVRVSLDLRGGCVLPRGSKETGPGYTFFTSLVRSMPLVEIRARWRECQAEAGRLQVPGVNRHSFRLL